MKIICSFCKQEKEHYAKGFCRNCYARYNRRGSPEYFVWTRQSNEERLAKARERSNKYRKENPEKVAISKSNYYKKNKDKISNYKKEWYLKNRERILKKHQDKKIKKENKNG